MTQQISPIQKQPKKAGDLSIRSSLAQLLTFVRSLGFLNRKLLLAASGVSLLSVPAAYALQAQFGTTSDTPVSNVNVDASVKAEGGKEAKQEAPEVTATVETSTTESTGAATNNNGVSGSVTINGQTVPLPENGTINKTVTNNNGHSSVSINVNGSQSATGFSHTHIHSNSTSGSTSVNINQNSSVSSP